MTSTVPLDELADEPGKNRDQTLIKLINVTNHEDTYSASSHIDAYHSADSLLY